MMTSIDVAIVGLGPVGATLANFLGLYGVQTAVFERDEQVYPHPRAVHADDETLRILQATGLFEALAPALGNYDRREYINAQGEVYFETILPQSKPLGHQVDIYFHQPTMDGVLRDGLSRFECVSVYTGHEVTAFDTSSTASSAGYSASCSAGHSASRSAGHSAYDYNYYNEAPLPVTLSVREMSTGREKQVQAKYVIGCDGGRSMVRKRAGIRLTDLGFDQPWLVVDVTLKPGETRESANVPFVHRQYCNPEQPISYIPSGVQGHFRWEFMLRDGDDREAVQHPENVRRLLSLVVNPDKFRIDRAAVYTFHSLVAEQLRVGSLFIAGDAAHQMPPFAGQGMCSGLRDAHNLAWKLALVLKQGAQPQLLDSYSQERIPHVTRMTKGTMFLGNLVQTQSPWRARVRDLLFKTLFSIPAVYARLARFALRPPDLKEGVLGTLRPNAAGTPFPQPLVKKNDGTPTLLDEFLGSGFALLLHEPKELMLSVLEAFKTALSGVPLQLLTTVSASSTPHPTDDIISIQEQEDVLSTWFKMMQAEAVLIRPDRYVFDACRLADLHTMLESLKKYIY